MTDIKCEPISISDSDLKLEWYSGSGAGGQHRNKHQNSVRMTHVPTGIIITAQCRSRENSLMEAKKNLQLKLEARERCNIAMAINNERELKKGTGMRGSFIRSYCFQHNTIKDARSMATITPAEFRSGLIDRLWY